MKIGDTVRLRADEDEGWDEEVGVVLGIQPTAIMVEVDTDDPYDDGLREVTADQII